jgi:heterodisulfide reductase subunit B
MGVICPSCFDSFDTGQLMIARKYGLDFTIPPVYYFQLLALAQGHDPSAVGLDRHKIKPERLLEALAIRG